jgi:hypothetical protein
MESAVYSKEFEDYTNPENTPEEKRKRKTE